MPVIAAVGGQWGDEGKGKVIDQLAEAAQLVVRFSGGDNAGHTVINPHGEFKLHLIPAGIFYPHVVCVIGNGVVVNPAVFLKEKAQLEKRGLGTGNLFISDRANLVMPYHRLQDNLEEKARGGKALGTTHRGIGPAFADKAARLGIRAGELMDKDAFRERLGSVLEYKNRLLTKVYEAEPLSFDEVFEQYMGYAELLAPHIKETTAMLEMAAREDKVILLEGAQGTLLDPDFGTYPFCSSSSPLAANGCLGSGIGPTDVDCVLGVYKAYCTRVGAGPMPTELHDETGDFIRNRAGEFGTTTGRPRRIGWFDAVAARFTRRVNGLTGTAITRLDILDVMPRLNVCVAYRLDGKIIDYFPADAAALERCQPVYEELEGWLTDTSAVRDYEKLPLKARKYLERMEELMLCPVNLVCAGPAREQTITKTPVW
ncbi:MAG: adenylosuccinate synthase [Dehalococcoidales bacterium]